MNAPTTRPPVHNIDLFLAPASAQAALQGILHTILFQRLFISAKPVSRNVLSTTLPALDDPDIESLLSERSISLLRTLDSSSAPRPGSSPSPFSPPDNSNGGRGVISISFFERKRRKTYSFFGKGGSNDDLVCWERWEVDVTMARPRDEKETEKANGAVERSLDKAARKIVLLSMQWRDHIPPITTTEGNPFPYEVTVGRGGG